MELNNFQWDKVKQLSITKMLLATFIPSFIAFLGFHLIAPRLVDSGMSKIYSWAFVANIMLSVLVLIGIFLLHKESKNLGISIFERMCFRKVPLKLWIIAGIVMILSLITVSGATQLIIPINKFVHFTIPNYTPFFLNQTINPAKVDFSVIDPNVMYKGNYFIVFIMAITLFLNILAEELYFRAWMLPKLSTYGKWSWVINGLLFALYHTFQLWMFPVLIVASLSMAFVFYKTKSILPTLIGHFIGNFILSILSILFIVMGLI